MLTPQATSHAQGTGPIPQLVSLRGTILLATALGIVLLLYGYSLVRTAWLGDDAYITFRTIENFLAGHGLTWNTDERVQAYTHPLWMFVLAGVRAITGEIYYTSLFTSMALSLAAVLLLTLKIARTWGHALFAAALCTFSKTFVDYSTSGLENPLSYLLVAWFLLLYLLERQGTGNRGQGTAELPQPGSPLAEETMHVRQERPGSRLLPLSLLASLILLNRMDLALLIAPALLHAFWQTLGPGAMPGAREKILQHEEEVSPGDGHADLQREGPSGATPSARLVRPSRRLWPLRQVAVLCLGLLPFLAWEIFSVIYYGFPFPNTAYAKLNTGIAAADLASHGLDYLGDSLFTDPLTIVTIAVALVAGAIARTSRHRALAIGITLYLLYIIRIGGDFMSGRYLAIALLVSAAQLATLPVRLSTAGWLSGALLAACLGLLAPHPPVLTTNLYGLAWSWRPDIDPIVDERAYYYPQTGLLHDRLGIPSPAERLKETAAALRQNGLRAVGFPTIGVFGYHVGPEVYVVDYCALADPLLARLPMKDDPNWRIGHFTRHVPDGYLERLQSPTNRLSDPRLDAFYEKLRLITRGPIFSRQRWQAILDMNLGRCDSLIDTEFYRQPPERVWLSQVSGGPRPRNVKDLPHRPDGAFDLPPNGFLVALGPATHAPTLEISVDADRQYRIDYPQPARYPVCQEIPAASTQPGRIARRIDVPPEVASQGYNRLRIYPAGRGPHTLGFLRPIAEGNTATNGNGPLPSEQ